MDGSGVSKKSYKWHYIDDNGDVQGPFPSHAMKKWLSKGAIEGDLQVRYGDNAGDPFLPITHWYPDLSSAFSYEPEEGGGGGGSPGRASSPQNRGVVKSPQQDGNKTLIMVGAGIGGAILLIGVVYLIYLVVRDPVETEVTSTTSTTSIAPVGGTTNTNGTFVVPAGNTTSNSVCTNGLNTAGEECGTACVGVWIDEPKCHSGYNVHYQTFSIISEAEDNGLECSDEDGSTRVPTQGAGCGDGLISGTINSLSVFQPSGGTDENSIKSLIETDDTNKILVTELAKTWGVDRHQVTVSGVTVSLGNIDYILAAESSSEDLSPTTTSTTTWGYSRRLQESGSSGSGGSSSGDGGSSSGDGGSSSGDGGSSSGDGGSSSGGSSSGSSGSGGSSSPEVTTDEFSLSFTYEISKLPLGGRVSELSQNMTGDDMVGLMSEGIAVFLNDHQYLLDEGHGITQQQYTGNLLCSDVSSKVESTFVNGTSSSVRSSVLTPVDCEYKWIVESPFCIPPPEPEVPELGEDETTTTTTTSSTEVAPLSWGTYDRTLKIIVEPQHGGQACPMQDGAREVGASCHNCTLAIGDYKPKCELTSDRVGVVSATSKRSRVYSDQEIWGGVPASHGGQCEELGTDALTNLKCPFRCLDGEFEDDPNKLDDENFVTHAKLYGDDDTTCGKECVEYTDLRCSSGKKQMEGWTGEGWVSASNYGKNCKKYRDLVDDSDVGWTVPEHNPSVCGLAEMEGRVQMELAFTDGYERFDGDIATKLVASKLTQAFAEGLGVELDQVTEKNGVSLVVTESSDFTSGHVSGEESNWLGKPDPVIARLRRKLKRGFGRVKKSAFRKAKRRLDDDEEEDDPSIVISVSREGKCKKTTWEGVDENGAPTWKYHGYVAAGSGSTCPCKTGSGWVEDCDDDTTGLVYDNFVCKDEKTAEVVKCPCLDVTSSTNPKEIECPALKIIDSEGVETVEREVPFPLEVTNIGQCKSDGLFPNSDFMKPLTKWYVVGDDSAITEKEDCPIVNTNDAVISKGDFKCVQDGQEVDCPCVKKHDYGTTYQGYVELADCPCHDGSATVSCEVVQRKIEVGSNFFCGEESLSITPVGGGDAVNFFKVEAAKTASSSIRDCPCVKTTITRNGGDTTTEEISSCNDEVTCVDSAGKQRPCPLLHRIEVDDTTTYTANAAWANTPKSRTEFRVLEELCYKEVTDGDTTTQETMLCPKEVTSEGGCAQQALVASDDSDPSVTAFKVDSSVTTQCPVTLKKMKDQVVDTSSVADADGYAAVMTSEYDTTLEVAFAHSPMCFLNGASTVAVYCPCLAISQHFYGAAVSVSSIFSVTELDNCQCKDSGDALHNCLDGVVDVATYDKYVMISTDDVATTHDASHLLFSADDSGSNGVFTLSAYVDDAVVPQSHDPKVGCYTSWELVNDVPTVTNKVNCPVCILEVKVGGTALSYETMTCPVDSDDATSSAVWEVAQVNADATTCGETELYTRSDGKVVKQVTAGGSGGTCLMVETFESGEIRDYSKPLEDVADVCTGGSCPCLRKVFIQGDLLVRYEEATECPCYYVDDDGTGTTTNVKIWADCAGGTHKSTAVSIEADSAGMCTKGKDNYELVENGVANKDAIACAEFETTYDTTSVTMKESSSKVIEDGVKKTKEQYLDTGSFELSCWEMPNGAMTEATNDVASVPVQPIKRSCPCMEKKQYEEAGVSKGTTYSPMDCPDYKMTVEWDFEVKDMVEDGGARLQQRIKDNAGKEDVYHENWDLGKTLSTEVCNNGVCENADVKFWTYRVGHCKAEIIPETACADDSFRGLYSVVDEPMNGGDVCAALYVKPEVEDDDNPWVEGTSDLVDPVTCRTCRMEWHGDFSQCATYTTTTTTTTSNEDDEEDDASSEEEEDTEETVLWSGQYTLTYRIQNEHYAYYSIPTNDADREVRVDCNFWEDAGADTVVMKETIVGDCSAEFNEDDNLEAALAINGEEQPTYD